MLSSTQTQITVLSDRPDIEIYEHNPRTTVEVEDNKKVISTSAGRVVDRINLDEDGETQLYHKLGISTVLRAGEGQRAIVTTKVFGIPVREGEFITHKAKGRLIPEETEGMTGTRDFVGQRVTVYRSPRLTVEAEAGNSIDAPRNFTLRRGPIVRRFVTPPSV